MEELTGVVLCGGAGRRMGRDKAMLAPGGRPLVSVAAERLGRVADPVLISSGPRTLPGLSYEQLDDARPEAGPLGGIVSALRATRSPLLAVVAADMPFVNAELLSLLARVRTTEDAVVPVDDQGPQPLHAVYAGSALEPAERALSQGAFSLRALLESLDVRYVYQEVWREVDRGGRFALNLNTPEDLAKLQAEGALGDL